MNLEQEDRPHIMWSPSRSVCGGGGGGRGAELDFLQWTVLQSQALVRRTKKIVVPCDNSQSQLTLSNI